MVNIRGSSNGRTPGFGPGYRGSNPCPRAQIRQARISLFFLDKFGIMSNMVKIIKYSSKYRKDFCLLMEQLQDYLVSIDSLGNLIRPQNYGEKYVNILLNQLKSDKGVILLAFDNDKVVGCIVGIIEKLPIYEILGHKIKHKSARVIELCVDSEFRGKNIGSLLMNELEKYFISKKCDQIRVEAYAPNKSAHNFYRKCGYLDESIDLVKKI